MLNFKQYVRLCKPSNGIKLSKIFNDFDLIVLIFIYLRLDLPDLMPANDLHIQATWIESKHTSSDFEVLVPL